MKEKIKELRVRIDGLSQLVEGLEQGIKFMIDLSAKPKNITVAEWLEIFKQTNFLFVDGFNNSKAIYENVEIKECHKNLILAKAWLGKVLGELGENTPYVNDGSRKTLEDIEPTADTIISFGIKGEKDYVEGTLNKFQLEWIKKTHVAKVDWLRQEIKKIFEEWRNLKMNGLMWTQVVGFEIHIQEARFWLGFELQRIKENG